MEEYTATKEQVKAELIRRFNASTARSGAIVITMKLDNVKLIIVPGWCLQRDKVIEKADMFTVYVDVPEGRMALPCLGALNLDELVYNIMHYSGINFDVADESIMYLMNHSADFVAEYDMYDDVQQREIRALQNAQTENDDDETDFYFM